MAEVAAGVVVAEQVIMTGVEGGAAAAIARPSQPLRGSLSQIARSPREDTSMALARSLHTVTCIGSRAYIFGGESAPGKLCPTDIHAISLSSPPSQAKGARPEKPPVEYACYPAVPLPPAEGTPAPRRSHAACARGKHLVLHGGDSGDGSPVDDEAAFAVWLWDSESLEWSLKRGRGWTRPGAGALDDSPPARRFGHSIFVDEKNDLLILHGGRTGAGAPVMRETWVFHFDTLNWTGLAPSPAPSSSCAYVAEQGTLYAISGTSDLGHTVHFLRMDPDSASGGADADVELAPPVWQSVQIPTSPLVPGPRPRVGAALLPVRTGLGRHYLLYLFGSRTHAVADGALEDDLRNPSSPTTLAAVAYTEERPFYSDAWALQLPSLGLTGARIKDAVRDALPGLESGRWGWSEVGIEPSPHEDEARGKEHPGPRGFFGASVLGSGSDVVFWGGENAAGAREADGWLLKLW